MKSPKAKSQTATKAKSQTATKKAAKPKQPTVNQKLISLSEAGQANSVAIGQVSECVSKLDRNLTTRINRELEGVRFEINALRKMYDYRVAQTEIDLEGLTDDYAKFSSDTRDDLKHLGEILYKNDKHLADALSALNGRFEKELSEVKKKNSYLQASVDGYRKRLHYAEASINNLQVGRRTMRAFQEKRASLGEVISNNKHSKSYNVNKEGVIKIAGLAFVSIGVVGIFYSLGHSMAVDLQDGISYLGGFVALALGGAFALAK